MSELKFIPIGKDKIPTVKSWQASTDDHDLAGAYGVGLVCGNLSMGLECIDIDCKYDITGTLLDRYKEAIHESDPALLSKLTVQKTVNGGYHFLYRCSRVEGNQKLASRETTEEEKALKPKEKVKVLIETRGEGGYVAVSPTPGYEIVYGSLEAIQYITPEERETLIGCAYLFNTYAPLVNEKREQKQFTNNTGLSPFEDYNERGDIVEVLQQEGWKLIRQYGTKYLFLRPGGEGKWSADWDESKKVFFVFTTSTEFEGGKGYSASQAYSKLRFNDNYSEAAKHLMTLGYGDKQSTSTTKSNLSQAVEEDDDLSFISTDEDTDEYIESIINGTFKMGTTTGFPSLDKHFVFKENHLVMVLGHDNVGKSAIIWYLALLSAKLHGWKWVIYSVENSEGSVKRRLTEFCMCKTVKEATPEEYKEAKAWVKEYFFIIKLPTMANAHDVFYSYKDILVMTEKIIAKHPGQIKGLMIDPYNALYKPDKTDSHEWDYKAYSVMRFWIDQFNCSIYLNCHAATEALRRLYPKEHKHAGYPMPPHKADAEGGGKVANKADDFLVIHRLIQHPTEWMFTDIHVRKIKEKETGGSPTPLDEPVRLRMLPESVGFQDMEDTNPIGTVRYFDRGEDYQSHSRSFHEPKKEKLDF